jgi:hypothetical protein
VVKREKSKTHEAQTTRVLEIQQRKRAGRCCCARPRMMTKTFWGSPSSRDKDNARLRHVLAEAQVHGGEHIVNVNIIPFPYDDSSPGKKAFENARYVTSQATGH